MPRNNLHNYYKKMKDDVSIRITFSDKGKEAAKGQQPKI